MWKVIRWLFCLLVWTGVKGQSPCPEVFRYTYNGTHWNGFLTVSKVPNRTVKVNVNLSVAAILPSQYAGEIKLLDSKELVHYSMKNNGDVHYEVIFPISYPLPVVTLVTVNEKRICTGPAARGSFVTSISLEHTLFIKMLSTEPSEMNKFKFGQPDETTTPNRFGIKFRPDPTDEPSINSRFECGTTALTMPLVVNGNPTDRGLYPWLAAIFVQTHLGISFMCGGNLISKRHVLTAAHCIILSSQGPQQSPDEFVVMLGKYRIKKFNEIGARIIEVEKIDLHPDNTIETADADLAILTLVEDVSFSIFIRPICLFGVPQALSDWVGLPGTIAGWGRDENGNYMTSVLRDTTVEIVSQESCLRSHVAFRDITSDRTFCAGATENGNGPCTGDSGGGLYVSVNGKWFLRGIVSRSIAHSENKLGCDTNNYSVFVDVSKFIDWINQIL